MSESKKNKYTLTIGADPEFFVMDGTGKDAKQIMACGRFGGTKGAPQLLTDEGGFLEDGTAIEFNLTTSQSLADTQAKIFRLLTQFEKARNCKISAYSSVSWPMAELRQFPQAMQLGCAPDMYAYGLRTAPSVVSFKNKRFAGGHIHVGIDPWPVGLEKVNVVKLLDAAILAPIQPWIYDAHRYVHYGYPGLYRETSYGVEWRSPDNLWCNPHWLEKVASGESNKTARSFVKRFDEVTQRLLEIVNLDEHGNRLNALIDNTFRETRLENHLTSPIGRRSPQHTGAHRVGYTTFSANLREAVVDPQFHGTEAELA